MLKNDGKDYIYVIWKQPNTRRQYIIGELVKNGKYEFFYEHEVKDAIKEGFNLLISFDDLDKTYYCDELFPTFSSRLPDRKRRGIEKILKKYNLEEYDAYELLKRSGAKLPIDNLEFIDPMPNQIESDIKRYFYIAGVRHWIGCEQGKYCSKSAEVSIGDKFSLELESDNAYDSYAVKILDNKSNIIGYIPRYYSENLTNFIKAGYKYSCEACIVNKDYNCNECIKVKLKVFK